MVPNGTVTRDRNTASPQGERPRVLVLGDDTQAFLAIVRSLGRKGCEIHAAPFDWHAAALKSAYIDKVHQLPRLEPDVDAWIEAVEALLKTTAFDLIVPCTERAMLPLWHRRDLFKGAPIAFPGAKAMDVLFDKCATRRLAAGLGIPVASGRVMKNEDTAESLVAEFGRDLVIKARRSFALDNLSDRGRVVTVTSTAETERALERCINREDHLVEARFPATGKGVGVGISVLARRGTILTAFQHRRLREKPGGGASSERISERPDPAMLDACRALAAETELDGVAMFEFRQDAASDAWILLEVNARFWGSVALPIAAGVNFPALLFEQTINGAVTPPPGYRIGVRSANALQSLRHLVTDPHISAPVKLWRMATETVRRCFNWLTGREALDEFEWDDMAPGLTGFAQAPGRFVRRRKWQQTGKPRRRLADATIAAARSQQLPVHQARP